MELNAEIVSDIGRVAQEILSIVVDEINYTSFGLSLFIYATSSFNSPSMNIRSSTTRGISL